MCSRGKHVFVCKVSGEYVCNECGYFESEIKKIEEEVGDASRKPELKTSKVSD